MSSMTSLQRVLTTVGQKEPDRVPLFLLLSMHGAREMKTSIKDYFASAERVAEAQLRMQRRYQHDCLYGFFYAPVEVEAFGGEVVFRDDGPPNSGAPILRSLADIEHISVPVIEEAPSLTRVLSALGLMKREVHDEIPIIGVVMSPFSLPVMQMGFERYLDLMFTEPEALRRLMQINEEFCVSWANAQLTAGATIICYFDPVSSPTVVTKRQYIETGLAVARRTIARIHGPVATHLASGRCLPIADELATTGTVAVGVSAEEDLAAVKSAFRGRETLVGNLNGIAMREWSKEHAEAVVKTSIAAAGTGGGFILSDNHGEIPFQVPESVLIALSDAVRRWGQYPLSWVNADGH